jgi:1-deoxy-D-xylulose-5-phosphate reductoisomerase
MEKFPCLRLAYEAVEAGGAKTVALNAADEVAVAAFLGGSIRFDQISVIISEVLSETSAHKLESINKVLEADSEARKIAVDRVEQLGHGKISKVTVGASQSRGE